MHGSGRNGSDNALLNLSMQLPTMLDHREVEKGPDSSSWETTDDNEICQSRSARLCSSSDADSSIQMFTQCGLSVHVKNTFIELCDSSGDAGPPDSPRAQSDPGTYCRELREAPPYAEPEHQPTRDGDAARSCARAAPAAPAGRLPAEPRAAARPPEHARGRRGIAEPPGAKAELRGQRGPPRGASRGRSLRSHAPRRSWSRRLGAVCGLWGPSPGVGSVPEKDSGRETGPRVVMFQPTVALITRKEFR
ncbi:unnamed protein product, partial [Prorocentrum cordatum]